MPTLGKYPVVLLGALELCIGVTPGSSAADETQEWITSVVVVGRETLRELFRLAACIAAASDARDMPALGL